MISLPGEIFVFEERRVPGTRLNQGKYFMYAVILAGGVGTRLWPRSRQHQPKQFSDIIGNGQTMIQETVARLDGLVADEDLYVVTGARYAGLTRAQIPQMPAANIIAEPSGRNTAPAIGLACAHLAQRDADAVVAILPADHIIANAPAFQRALRRAEEIARQGYLVTLGIEPTLPHTGYGYIQRDELLMSDAEGELAVYHVQQFLEKPNLATAQNFLLTGGYYWNGGIFVCRVGDMLSEMARQMPTLHETLQNVVAKLEADEPFDELWSQMPNVSIDYGVMEGAARVAVVPLVAGWNDVGSWDALLDIREADINGNYIARGDTICIDSSGNVIYSDKLVALIGVEDLVVVDAGDTLLVGHKSKMQNVKQVVQQLQEMERHDLL